ncbi:molybdopterin-binding protein [Saccharomonospora piscinae]|uniref:Molybdopterin-binding protein n=1 Tax=Saccharomonospora piscinae TaxID=687388 RepID=A0A1V9A9M0_SACPI|nr:molybdopterin-dependent oxidoreductase [Saccharomonospora piscinae]OQO93827.1 molybdopterin-binding protein [Saccharomonospora piscinae]
MGARPRFRSEAHDARVTSRVGVWLGVAFGLCFLTGLLSHLLQHPPGWFAWPTRPVYLYGITQGIHVVSGVIAVPLLLAKLWSVYPRLFQRPVVRSAGHALERLSILVLVSAAFFQLVTGLFNVAQNYAFGFFFPQVHYLVAWVAIGSVLVHVAVKLPVVRRTLREPLDSGPPEGGLLSRRGFLRVTAVAGGTAAVATAGAPIEALRPVTPLTWATGPGLPVNRTAAAANVRVDDPDWRLAVAVPGGTRTFTRAALAGLPQTTARLPITCVEGWTATATWTGVAVPDLLRAAGVPEGRAVRLVSLERGSLWSVSELSAHAARDRLALLALRLDGADLPPDHGYPCRLIAPNRPGVLQTKWLDRIEVL